MKKTDSKSQYIVACATLSLIVTIMIFVLGLVIVSLIEDIQVTTQQRVEQLKDQKFNEVWGLIISAQHSAYLHSNVVRDRIVRAIERIYYTPELLEKLQYELSNPSSDNQIVQVLKNAINGMYMYYNTNFNGMSVIVTYDILENGALPTGYLIATHNNNFTDNISLNITNNSIVLLSDLIDYSYNSYISKQHMKHIAAGTSAVGQIPFIQTDYPNSNIMLRNMDLYSVYEAFLRYGMSVFYSLVVSGSSYIFDREDIFGVPNISTIGQAINNHGVIITQHFRVADMINRHHAAQIARYDIMIENAIQDGSIAMNYRQVVFIFMIAFWMIFILVITIVQNSIANKIELLYLRGRHSSNI